MVYKVYVCEACNHAYDKEEMAKKCERECGKNKILGGVEGEKNKK